MLNLTKSGVRGCGSSRTRGGCYLCTGTSPDGQPIENFLIDPIQEWEFQRGYKLVKDVSGEFNNVLVFVGKDPGKGEGYQHFWQFVEEARNLGVSRKVPKNFPIEQLTAGRSKMIFAHSQVVPLFEYGVDETYPKKWCKLGYPHPDCVYDGRDLSFLKLQPKAETIGNEFEIKFESYSYKGIIPEVSDEEDFHFAPGLFMATYLSHIEFPHEENLEFKQRANQAGFETAVTEY